MPDSGGLVVIPALNGLGAPWWDPEARGVLVGVTTGTGRAQLARATLEAIAFQVRDVLDVMSTAGNARLACLRVDGGVSVVNLLLQIQADQAGIPVARPRVTETTALGAAQLAGLAEAVWSSLGEVAACWTPDLELSPRISRTAADSRQATWLAALERARGWAKE